MMLVTIRQGPVLHLWRDGVEVAAVPLTPAATLTLTRELLAALPIHLTQPKGPDHG